MSLVDPAVDEPAEAPPERSKPLLGSDGVPARRYWSGWPNRYGGPLPASPRLPAGTGRSFGESSPSQSRGC